MPSKNDILTTLRDYLATRYEDQQLGQLEKARITVKSMRGEFSQYHLERILLFAKTEPQVLSSSPSRILDAVIYDGLFDPVVHIAVKCISPNEAWRVVRAIQGALNEE